MKSTILAIILIFTISSASAKSFPGYIINLAGDTTHGYITIGSEKSTHQEISFSKALNSDSKTIYKPFEILGFQFLGTRFLSAEVPVEEPFQKELNEKFKRPKSNQQNVFLLVDVDGFISLYYYKAKDNREHYYVKSQSENFQELTKYVYKGSREKTFNNQGANGKIVYNLYQDILSNLFIGCEEVKAKIKKTRLTRDDLIKLIKKYNECQNPELEIYINENAQEIPINIFIKAGVNLPHFHFVSTGEPWEYRYLINDDFPLIPTPVIGAEIRLYFSSYQPKWFISTGAWYKYFKIEGDYKDFPVINPKPGDYTNFTFDAQVKQITIPLSIGIRVPIKDFSASFKIGGLVSGSSLNNYFLTSQRYLNGETIFAPSTEIHFLNFSNVEYSAIGGIGLQYKKLGIEACGTINRGLFSKNGGTITMNGNSLILLLTYQLK